MEGGSASGIHAFRKREELRRAGITSGVGYLLEEPLG